MKDEDEIFFWKMKTINYTFYLITPFNRLHNRAHHTRHVGGKSLRVSFNTFNFIH
jgi:hypothetical protein